MTNHKQETQPQPGRPKLMTGQQTTVTLRLTTEQREKLARLGGAAWVREQIEAAKIVPQKI